MLAAIGRRVGELRAARGWTQEQLAERLTVATRNLQAIERGQRNVTVGTLVRVAAALGVEVPVLFSPPSTPLPGPGRPLHPNPRRAYAVAPARAPAGVADLGERAATIAGPCPTDRAA